MPRSPFPTADFGRNTSDRLIGTGIGAPGSEGASAIAGAASEFGRRLRGVADRAYVREGEADAVSAIQGAALIGGEARFRGGNGLDDQAYDAIVREKRGTDRQAAYLEQVAALEIEHGENLGAFTEALAATRKGFTDRPTGDVQLDTSFGNFVTLQDAAAARRVRVGDERRRVATARGVLTTAVATGQTALGQAITSAGLDDAGAQLVGASLNQFAGTIARFGPREAFSIGGIEFPPDPTRSAAADPDDLARLFDRAQAQARMSWISNAADLVEGSQAKSAFVGQVRERWAAGDAMFTGLDAGQMDQLVNRLEGGVARAETDERGQRTATASWTRDQIAAAEYGGPVDPEQLRTAAAASGDVGLQAEVEWRLTHGFDITPAKLRELSQGGMSGGVGLGSVVDFILDDLEGSGRVADDNGRGPAEWGITRASHPEAWADGRVDRAEAAAIYRRDYVESIGAGSMSPEMALVASAAAVIGGPATARALLADAGNDPERFLQLEMARFERLARENPAKYADDLPGWRGRHGKIRGMLGGLRQQVRTREGFIADPLGHAAGSGTRAPLATVATYDPAGVFGDDAAVQAWASGVRQNVGVSESLTHQYSVPSRVFSNDDVEIYKQAVAQDPANLMKLAGGLIAAVGPDKARQALGELGRQGLASADIHLAALAMDDATRPVAAHALEGRALRLAGAAVPAFEKNDDGQVPTIRQSVQSVSNLLRSLPEVVPAIEQLATDISVADAARGQLRPPIDYVNAALGAVRRGDQIYGGLGTIERGGRDRALILPSWLRSDGADDVVDLAIDQMTGADIGPAYANGTPIPPSRLKQYEPVRTRRGYAFVNPDTGSFVAGRQGQIFEFDLASDQFRRAVAARHPELVAP